MGSQREPVALGGENGDQTGGERSQKFLPPPPPKERVEPIHMLAFDQGFCDDLYSPAFIAHLL